MRLDFIPSLLLAWIPSLGLCMPALQLSVPLGQLAAQNVVLLSDPKPTHPQGSLPVANSTKSFWIDSPNANPLAKEGSTGPLTEEADVCIIGSGITGISAAYHLSKLDKQLKVVVLEARDFCSGATGRNGGHLTPSTFLEFSRRQREMGTKYALSAHLLEDHNVYGIIDILERHGLKDAVDLVEGGHMELLLTEPEVQAVNADYDAAKEAGVDLSKVKWYSKDKMKEEFGAEYPGVKFPGYNVWPLKLVTHLYHLSKSSFSSNLTLHTSTPVTSISDTTSSKRRFALHTPRGKVQCSSILHATNAYSSYLLPHLHGPNGIIPTRGQVIAVRASVPLSTLGRTGFSGNEGFEYWFPRPVANPDTDAPLVILGGGRETTGPDYELYVSDDSEINPTAGEALRGFLPGVYPGRYEVGREPEMEWTGIMGFTNISDPFVGPIGTKQGQFISAGYTGHGMPRAYACAEAVAQMILAERTGRKWEQPDWLPDWYLTSRRGVSTPAGTAS